MNRIASLAAAALAAGGIALAPTPATADSDDLAKIIAGIAVAGIVAKAIDDRKDRKRARQQVVTRNDRYYDYNQGIYHDRRRTIDGTVRRFRLDDDDGFRRDRQGFKRLTLPRRCLRTVDTARGSRLAYGARCLNRNFRHADKLPRRCETAIRTPRGFRVVYGSRCLARDGWKVARR